MKKYVRPAAGLLLALILTLGMTGCAGVPLIPGGEPSTPTPSAGAETPAPSDGPLGQQGQAESADAVERLVGVPRTTPVFSVDGADVDAEEFFYWLGFFTENLAYSKYGDPSKINWEDEVNGLPLSEALINSARDAAALYTVVRTQCAQRSLSPTPEQQAAFDLYMEEYIASLGGEEAYHTALEQIGRSDEGLRRLLLTNTVLSSLLQDAVFPLEEISDEALAAWAEENGKMQVKHILFKTVDDSYTPLPEEEAAAAKEKAEATLAELRAAEDLEALFDEKMNALSEDGRTADGALAAPNGYFFGDGEMVAEFQEAAKALKEHEMSGLVETPYGYHILLRLPIDPDMARETWETAAKSENEEKMNDQLQVWIDEAEIVTTDLFDTVDPQSFYTALCAYRESLEPEDAAEPQDTAQPQSSPAPSPTPSAQG